ncbi:MAG: hypothetical protein IPM36_00615 [Lewinellaceae bacterium]|nr:hypothetical protein [Lewinellaceae bacterium]
MRFEFKDSDTCGLRLGFGLGESQALRVIHHRWRFDNTSFRFEIARQVREWRADAFTI